MLPDKVNRFGHNVLPQLAQQIPALTHLCIETSLLSLRSFALLHSPFQFPLASGVQMPIDGKPAEGLAGRMSAGKAKQTQEGSTPCSRSFAH